MNRAVACRSCRPNDVQVLWTRQLGCWMILPVSVRLKEIVDMGKGFPWPRPQQCPRCGSHRLWGHGFVEALFDGFPFPVWLKRYRCPDCRCLVRLRPSGYFRRFQASNAVIRTCIACMLCTGRWPANVSRSRQDYWFRNLCRRVCTYCVHLWPDRLLEGFDQLCETDDAPPVSRLK